MDWDSPFIEAENGAGFLQGQIITKLGDIIENLYSSTEVNS